MPEGSLCKAAPYNALSIIFLSTHGTQYFQYTIRVVNLVDIMSLPLLPARQYEVTSRSAKCAKLSIQPGRSFTSESRNLDSRIAVCAVLLLALSSQSNARVRGNTGREGYLKNVELIRRVRWRWVGPWMRRGRNLKRANTDAGNNGVAMVNQYARWGTAGVYFSSSSTSLLIDVNVKSMGLEIWKYKVKRK